MKLLDSATAVTRVRTCEKPRMPTASSTLLIWRVTLKKAELASLSMRAVSAGSVATSWPILRGLGSSESSSDNTSDTTLGMLGRAFDLASSA